MNGESDGQFIYERASFPSAHASTIVETEGGLVAAWFGGTREGAPDVCIWTARHAGARWSEPACAACGERREGPTLPCWNPVLFQPASGPLLLFYKVGPNPRAWWGVIKRSSDGGASWSEAERLPDGILGPIKNKPLELPGGALLCPSSTEQSGWRVRFELCEEPGSRWSVMAQPGQEGAIEAIQPGLLTHGPDRLQAVGRTRQGRCFSTWSTDGGMTWSPLTLLNLPNPNSGTDCVTLRDGRHLLVYNHSEQGRTPLNVAISADGEQWQPCRTLEAAPGEYSYPAVIQSSDGRIHITYSWNRTHIRHVTLAPDTLG